ncbi:hypothetical protein B0920_07280 [Massilia sp. KIM]|uniref:hypothetical protein n=1 Tax=Massilia sp. KIM TaxID=1955422 RepID=UPI00098FA7F9|nr:hypothetical protein [Massilia sp. KIM]OON63197.1 hypothetical protein B0920_07280 [Massilia sp. KIM]
MAHLTLVLPYALPLPEFAPDLARALNTPALAALLSRTSSHAQHRTGEAVHALPHETWLARSLGLEREGRPAFAAAAMRGLGLDPGEGNWFIVNPAHIQIARSHLMMADLRQLALSEDEGRALFEAARPLCEEAGHRLAYGDAGTWFLRADAWTGLDLATPDTVVGMDLTDFMPKGDKALPYRRLQNEIQMLWYAHPVNAAREARRLPPVNAFWLWGAADTNAGRHSAMLTHAVPGWLAALGGRRLDTLAGLDAVLGQDAMLVAGDLAEAAIAADWGSWVMGMQRFEEQLFAPLLATLKDGRLKRLRLVLSSREALLDLSTTGLAQRKFWNRPTLARLSA